MHFHWVLVLVLLTVIANHHLLPTIGIANHQYFLLFNVRSFQLQSMDLSDQNQCFLVNNGRFVCNGRFVSNGRIVSNGRFVGRNRCRKSSIDVVHVLGSAPHEVSWWKKTTITSLLLLTLNALNWTLILHTQQLAKYYIWHKMPRKIKTNRNQLYD